MSDQQTEITHNPCGVCGAPATLYGDEGHRCDDHAVWDESRHATGQGRPLDSTAQTSETERLARALCDADPEASTWDGNEAYWRQFAANLLDGILSDPDFC